MDAASHSGVDDTREILSGVPLATAGGRKKVYVIDEVHMLTTQSFNALLKTLEEPPQHVVFVMATTELHRVLPTIVSRTQRFDFRRVPADVIQEHLAHIAKLETIDIESAAVALLARHAEGSVRDALSTLDQLSNFGRTITELDVEGLLGHRNEEALNDVFEAIADSDVGALFSTMQTFVAQGADMRRLADDVLEHARTLLLLATAPEAEELLDVPVEDRPKLSVQAQRFSPGSLMRVLDLVGQAIIEMRNAPNHRLLLEIALVRSAAPDTDPSATGLLGRIERLERRIGIDSAPEVGGGAALPQAPPPSKSPSGSTTPPPTRAPQAAATREMPARAKTKPSPPRREDAVGADEHREEVRAAPAASRVAGNVGLAEFKDAWPAVMKEVNKISRRVGALLTPSRAVAHDGDTLTVSLQAEFHAGEMKKEANRSILAEGLFNVLGVRPALAFTYSGASDQPPEEEVETATDEEDVDATTAANDDPIELVKQGLGAEVVEERKG